jgi:hypothetical protein
VAPTSNNCSFRLGAAAGTTVGGNVEDLNECGLNPMSGDLINTNPLLGPLQDNGGPTETRALPIGSPAVDAGLCLGAPTDQRGYPRPGLGGAGCDSGAYELSVCNGAAVTQPTPPASCPPPSAGAGGGSQPGTTSTTPAEDPLCAILRKKLKRAKKAHNAAKVRKLRRKLRRLGC